jgi:hypothetical protein
MDCIFFVKKIENENEMFLKVKGVEQGSASYAHSGEKDR